MSFQSHSKATNTPCIYTLSDIPEAKGKKVHYMSDTRISNTGVFSTYLEGHTIGNLLRSQLLKDDKVIFSAYKVPHPLEQKVMHRVQTHPGDSTYDPLAAARVAIIQLQKKTDRVQRSFAEAMRQLQPRAMGGYAGGG
eukprot:GHVR01055422.1.p1 GENE.GHVR01055422.1~~GHVR01055422.1.p1  ORF type:complete len:148 (-),score=31.22 GHVR01055422.1:133-546(-)